MMVSSMGVPVPCYWPNCQQIIVGMWALGKHIRTPHDVTEGFGCLPPWWVQALFTGSYSLSHLHQASRASGSNLRRPSLWRIITEDDTRLAIPGRLASPMLRSGAGAERINFPMALVQSATPVSPLLSGGGRDWLVNVYRL